MRILILLMGLVLAGLVRADGEVPTQLESWRGWVQKGLEFRNCTMISYSAGVSNDDYACLWPGLLEIRANANGAEVSQHWQVDIDAWVPLPGNSEHWPRQVTVDGRPAVVVDREGPQVWMEAGDHDLRANLAWDDRPQSIDVPALIAVVRLVVDGNSVAPLQRSGNQLTLGRGKATTTEADSLDLRVFRKFTDSIPGDLETRIRMEVSGQPREEIVGPALPEGFLPLSLDNEERAVRLDETGMLHVQVHPGTNTVTLRARATVPVDKLTARLPEHWPEQEIWSYESVPSLRVTAVEGAIQVDPAQANVPNEWRNLPAYALDNAGVLQIEQRSRGLDANAANRLNLRREAWLDFSGNGWFAKDRINGSMQSGWRLDLAAPYLLQRAQAADGAQDALLITQGPTPGSTGVEWRNPQVAFNAGVRIDASGGSLPVAGWNQTFDSVATSLHLPFGYRLIAAPGADRASGSWMSKWTLLDVFLAAIIALLAGRLLGIAGGVIAAAYLVLGYQEPGAPLWSLLLVLVLSVLVRALPIGRLQSVGRGLRVAALVLLAILVLPFAAGQLRMALYPQLESGGAEIASLADNIAQEAYKYAEPMPAAAPVPQEADAQSPLESVVVTGNNVRRVDISQQASNQASQRAKLNKRYSKSSVVQTGGGEPGWQLGSSYQLSWSGPVLASQQVRLLIASPWLVRLLRVALVVLLAVLCWRLLLGARAMPVTRAGMGRAGALLLLAGMSASPQVQAQGFPSNELLQELKTRISEAPKCAPYCSSLAEALVHADGNELRVALEVHAQVPTAVAIPSDEKSLAISSILVDGSEHPEVANHGGALRLAVERGVHRVEIRYAVTGDRVELGFPESPHRVEFSGNDWQATGIADGKLLTEALSLTRSAQTATSATSTVEQRFPPFLRLHRTINLDLDWTIEGTAERLAPEAGGFTVNLDVLAGEHVQTPGLKVQDGKLTLALADGDEAASWESTLDQTTTLKLVAPDLMHRTEVWRIAVGPTWHVEFEGLPETPSPSNDSASDYHVFEFHPLPGETLSMKVQKPESASGASRAIDSLSVATSIGPRSRTHTLQMDMRSSQGGEQAITLPAGVELLGVNRNGEALGVRLLDRKLSLPLNPGSQKFEIRFQDNQEVTSRMATPEIDPGLPAANISLSIDLPNDRWLLAAFGPAVGPAVLFWGELLVAIVLAWLLARWRKGNLKFHHTLLLVLGFSTFSWIALVLVIGWLFALDWRSGHVIERNWKFNLAQLGLAALTLIAMICLFGSIQNGLLGSPDMVVRGNNSWGSHLQWFADRSPDMVPTAQVISLPLWVYNVVMLVWSLWLAWMVVGWVRKGFAAWMQGGYWRPWSVPKPIEIDTPPAPPAV